MEAELTLFDLDPEDDRVCTAFISLPSIVREATALAPWLSTPSVVAAVRSGLQRASIDATDPWLLRGVMGEDVEGSIIRLAGGCGLDDIQAGIRELFVRSVDACIGVALAPSRGWGREIGWALHLGIPTLVLIHVSQRRGPHDGAAVGERSADIGICHDTTDITAHVASWMTQKRSQVQAGERRRARPLADTEPLRLACREYWRGAEPSERERVARCAFAEVKQVDAVLADAAEWGSSRASLVLVLAHQLGVWSPAPVPMGQWVPDESEMRALHDAIATWDWDGQVVSEVMRLAAEDAATGSELALVGGRRRSANLEHRYGWRRLWQRVPDDVRNARP